MLLTLQILKRSHATDAKYSLSVELFTYARNPSGKSGPADAIGKHELEQGSTNGNDIPHMCRLSGEASDRFAWYESFTKSPSA